MAAGTPASAGPGLPPHKEPRPHAPPGRARRPAAPTDACRTPSRLRARSSAGARRVATGTGRAARRNLGVAGTARTRPAPPIGEPLGPPPACACSVAPPRSAAPGHKPPTQTFPAPLPPSCACVLANLRSPSRLPSPPPPRFVRMRCLPAALNKAKALAPAQSAGRACAHAPLSATLHTAHAPRAAAPPPLGLPPGRTAATRPPPTRRVESSDRAGVCGNRHLPASKADATPRETICSLRSLKPGVFVGDGERRDTGHNYHNVKENIHPSHLLQTHWP